MVDNKRIAAIAAVLAIIEAENAGASAAARPPVSAAVFGRLQAGSRLLAGGRMPAGGGSTPSPWGLYGRQRIMNMRALMQRRVSSRRV